MTSAEEVGRAVLRLADQVTHWTPSRWAASTTSGSGSRGAVAHALAQELADLEAAAANHEHHRVPRLPNDLALPDQWRVLARDLLDAGPDETQVRAAAEALERARAELFS